MTISEHYKRLADDEVEPVARHLADAWQSPEIPTRQYEAVVKKELEDYRSGKANIAFDALKTLLVDIPLLSNVNTKLLDVGASSGYYSEVLKIIGFQCQYTALDLSTYFKDLARELFPEIPFEVGSATDIPFDDKSFDIVLHGACLMHLMNYRKAIQEAARVAKRYVIFHRTPVYTDDTPTDYWSKTAYGVPCVEIHYNQASILRTFSTYGLALKNYVHIFNDGHFGHTSYLLEVQ